MLTMFRLVMAISLLLANCINENEMEKCEVRNTCRYNTKTDMPVCFCDKHCLKFSDCCQEYVTNNETVAQSDADFYSCVDVDVMSGRKIDEVRAGSFMIDRCKGSGSLCNITPGSLELIVPVSNGSETFRNSNCAKCNGVVNFKYWKIFVEIPRSDEVGILDIEPLLTRKSFLKLTNDMLPKVKYNLYPPDGYRPRYCSSEIFRKGTTIQKERLYQNFALFNNYLVKNPDQCLNDGSSISEEIKCVSYDATYLKTRNVTFKRNTLVRSLQVLVEIGSKSGDSETSTKEVIGGSSLTFMRKRLYIHSEINLEESANTNGSTQLIHECILSFMVLMQSSKYGLVNEHTRLVTETTDGLKHSSRMIVRSMTMLGLSEVKDLQNLFLNFQYKESNEQAFATGYLQAVSSNFTVTKLYTKRYVKIIDISRISLLSHGDIDIISCRNLSFSLQTRKHTATVYSVRCTDNPNDKNNRNRGNVGFQSIRLAVLSGIYALWLPRKLCMM